MEDSYKGKIAKHEELRQGQQYTQEKKFCDSILVDFIKTARGISICSIRGGGRENSLTFNLFDFFFESAVGISVMIKEGVLNPAKRELRYVLETSVKALLVDQTLTKQTYHEKIAYLGTSIPRSSIDCVDDINFFITDNQSKLLINDVKQLFGELSQYVHPSEEQIKEYILRCNEGASIGLETGKELKRMNAPFRTYEIVLVLSLHALGFSQSGDMFINLFDDSPKWKFHKGRHMKAMSALYDYKAERRK
ncbi:Hypothetical protein LUCI_0827 [Lucifera butyrica]|uniref:Uncharacterized protein n=1 Tax=Lucifera butyrica TaxID=1351585 RepID=A0A498R453_9FIRM|nr:hypothetical protein [Lucifera butyrica]VBB05617.1 Hypothetical protein LUCI_0827 [Lucifera butyrica]